jgi:integrase/recombinase XerD
LNKERSGEKMNDLELYFQKFLKHCKNQRRLSQDTVRAYGLDLKGFAVFLSTCDPQIIDCAEVTRHTLQEYVNFLNENFAVKTVRRRVASIRSFFNYLEGEEIIAENPFSKFHLNIKEPFRVPKTLSLNEVTRILEAVYGDSPTLFPVLSKLESFP